MDQKTRHHNLTPYCLLAAIALAVMLFRGGTKIFSPQSVVAQYIHEQSAHVYETVRIPVQAPQGVPISIDRVEVSPGPQKLPGAVSDMRVSGMINNLTNLPVVGIALSLSHPQLEYQYYVETDIHVAPKGSFTGELGRFREVDGEPASMRLEIVGVKFADGSVWGNFYHGLTTQGTAEGVGAPLQRGPSGGVSGGVMGGVKDGVVAGIPSNTVPSDSLVSTSSPGKVYRYKDDSITQHAVKHVQPDFSRGSSRPGSNDAIVVEIVVDSDGGVLDARVISGNAFGFLDRHDASLENLALQAARKWRFQALDNSGRKDTPVRMVGNLFFRVP